jgi:mRNA degradation ribonuclease J1/J2
VYEAEAEGLLAECANEVEKAVAEVNDKTDIEAIQRAARRAAGRFVNRETKRRPMIVPVVVEA